MSRKMKRATLISLIAALIFVTACASSPNQQQTRMNQAKDQERARIINEIEPRGQAFPKTQGRSQEQAESGIKGLTDNQGPRALTNSQNAVIPITTINQHKYVAANELAEVLNFQKSWDPSAKKLLLGDNDASFELSMDSTAANKVGEVINVDQPFVMQGDSAFIPVSALADLFQEDMSFEVLEQEVRVHAVSAPPRLERESDDNGQIASPPELDFAEDPNDPFKGPDGAGDAGSDAAAWVGEEDAIPVLKNIDINAMIRKSKQYLGVKYLFGAGPYPRTGKFDCSTYTQYIFGKYGYKLPRLSRQQATHGTLVSRKNLRKGDLMFFYVPGRFKTNRTVGHVGIYIGNMQMIHASPLPKDGVQITNINKAYWKETFLRAKRIVY